MGCTDQEVNVGKDFTKRSDKRTSKKATSKEERVVKLTPREWDRIVKQALELSKSIAIIVEREKEVRHAQALLARLRQKYAHPEQSNPGRT